MFKELLPLVCFIVLTAFGDEIEKITVKSEGDILFVTRVFGNGEFTESYQGKWVKQSRKRPEVVKKVDRLFPSAVDATGFWFRDGKYVLEKNGTPWISGSFSAGKCVGDWVEVDRTGKPKRRVTCKNGIPENPNNTGGAVKHESRLEVTDFHFSVGRFQMTIDDKVVTFQLPRRDVFIYDGKPEVGLEGSKEILIPTDRDYLQRNWDRARAVKLETFESKYANPNTMDGTTQTFFWRDGKKEKGISCYADCPDRLRKFYRETVDDFFQSPSNALELSAIGSYFNNNR